MRPFFISSLALSMLALANISPSHAANSARAAYISQTPPEPRDEISPGTRKGYLWTPGFWEWNGQNHVWRHGRWIAERGGYKWIPDSWEQRGDKWELVRGHWEEAGWQDFEAPIPEITPESPPVVSNEASNADSEEKPTALVSSKKRTSPPRKSRKPVDYSDPRKWPRYIKH